jgi:hypothetical protein
MGVPMSLQVVLTIEGQCTHIASKRAWRGSRVLHGTVDRGLRHILCLGLAVSHLCRLGSLRFRGAPIVAVIYRWEFVTMGGIDCRGEYDVGGFGSRP